MITEHKTFEQMFKEDFINHLVNHDNKSNGEAKDVWNAYGEYYIEEMYQQMSDSIYHYTKIFDNDKQNLKKRAKNLVEENRELCKEIEKLSMIIMNRDLEIYYSRQGERNNG